MARTPRPDVDEFVLDHVEAHPTDITALTAATFEMSRQAAHRRVMKLVERGWLHAIGGTRSRSYTLRILGKASLTVPLAPAPEESQLWTAHVLPQMAGVRENVTDICHYGFTEIVNNAVDHSQGEALTIDMARTARAILMSVKDNGVGIFHKIRKALKLTDDRQALLELAKGKFTTDPRRHSGEGIFFASRSFDNFLIMSGSSSYVYKQGSRGAMFEDSALVKGTAVIMTVSPRSERILKEVFDAYSGGANYTFRKTHVPLSLAKLGGEQLVSRSQAKRVLARFQNFEEVLLDFRGVKDIGQAFADEIFRVFALANPGVKLLTINASADVDRMIRRARALAASPNREGVRGTL